MMSIYTTTIIIKLLLLLLYIYLIKNMALISLTFPQTKTGLKLQFWFLGELLL